MLELFLEKERRLLLLRREGAPLLDKKEKTFTAAEGKLNLQDARMRENWANEMSRLPL